MLDATRPFVLLDDARPGGRAQLYRAPIRVIRADSVAAVPDALAALGQAVAEGA